jgi:hypothetical protein
VSWGQRTNGPDDRSAIRTFESEEPGTSDPGTAVDSLVTHIHAYHMLIIDNVDSDNKYHDQYTVVEYTHDTRQSVR